MRASTSVMIRDMGTVDGDPTSQSFPADEWNERAQTFHRLVVCGIFVLAIILIISIGLRPSRLWVHFPYVGMLAEHLLVLVINRRGHVRTAVAVHATLYM